MVIGVPCAGGGILTAGTSRARNIGTAARGAFGCAGAPGRKVLFAGGTSRFSAFLILEVLAFEWLA